MDNVLEIARCASSSSCTRVVMIGTYGGMVYGHSEHPDTSKSMYVPTLRFLEVVTW